MAKYGAGLNFIRNIKDTNNCILWPFYIKSNGYGQVIYNGKHDYAHRVSLFVHKPDTHFDGSQSSHSCRNRSCINPRHLEWKSKSDNELDKIRDGVAMLGERNHKSKLKKRRCNKDKTYA